MNITKFIKERILDEYGSIRFFAKKVKIPVSTLNTTLNKDQGFNNMPVQNAMKICKELGLDVEALYDAQSIPLSFDEQRLVNFYREVSRAGKSLMLNVCSEILKYEEMISTPRTLEQKKELLIAASGAEEDSDEIIDYNIELAKQIAEKEEKKRKKKKE